MDRAGEGSDYGQREVTALLVPTRGAGTAYGGGGGIAFAQDRSSRSAWEAVLFDMQRLRRISGDIMSARGERLRQALVADTTAGLGPRMGRTWARPRRYSGPPPVVKAVLIPSRAPHIIVAHDAPQTTISPNASSRLAVRGFTPRSTHRMLAIPTAAAGARGKGRFSNRAMTPGVYEQVYNTRLVRVGNVLIDPDLKIGKTGRRVRSGKAPLKGTVVFTLVPQVTLRQRINVGAVGLQILDQVINDIGNQFLSGDASR